MRAARPTILRRNLSSDVASCADLTVIKGMSSHADVIDPSRTVRKDNDIKELDQLIGRRSSASDAKNFST
jgi:hypothetical protein